MFFIFGWARDRKPVGMALNCHCYRCQRRREWEHWRETEWVSFFTIRTLPFLRKDFVVCSGCRDAIRIDGAKSRQLGDSGRHADLARSLEDHQLAQKTEVQRRFLLAQREQAENRRDR